MTDQPSITLYALRAVGEDLARWFAHRDRLIEAVKKDRHGRVLSPFADGDRFASLEQAAEWAAGDPEATVITWGLADRNGQMIAHSGSAFPTRRDAERDARELQGWASELDLILPVHDSRIAWFASHEARPALIGLGWYPERVAALGAASQALLALTVAIVNPDVLRRRVPSA